MANTQNKHGWKGFHVAQVTRLDSAPSAVVRESTPFAEAPQPVQVITGVYS